MKYLSTRGEAPAIDFKEALFTGLAPDGGLYIPERIPSFTPGEISQFQNKSYQDLTLNLLYPFVSGSISVEEFAEVIQRSLQAFSHHPQTSASGSSEIDPAPLRVLQDRLALLELFHGPTLAFKDFALQLLAALMNHFLQQERRKILILGATSGDTGSAAIEAFRHYPDVKIVILHPHNKVTPFQRRQMTTTGNSNVWNLAVEGNFDDCQKLVKDCFNGRGFLPSDYSLTAVNSINWARIMAQIVYYFSAFFQAGGDFGQKYCFTVPTGNFGNILAGYYAKCLGLPIEKLWVAVNENDILHRFFSNNDYRVGKLKPTFSPSMDILVSSNLERLLYLLQSSSPRQGLEGRNGEPGKRIAKLMDQFKNEEKLELSKEIWEEARKVFRSASCDNQRTLDTIKRCYHDYGVVIDPHTAVGLHAALSSNSLEDQYHIILSTAHPAKFAEAIEKSGVPVLEDPRNHDASHPEKVEVFPNDLNKLKGYLLSEVLG